jgi:aminoglycoside 3-N-acetyltransferase
MPVTRTTIAAALAQVGVVPGDVVMFHSSLSSMGHVDRGADSVIDAFLDAVGPTGTVAVPTLCRLPEDQWPTIFDVWNPAVTPSYVGKITEMFRHRPQAVRSDHATHSVAAIGPRAKELTAAHGSTGPRLSPWGDKAFAHATPWQRFYDWNAAYCFVGVDFTANTMVHFVESRLVEQALDAAPASKRDTLTAEVRDFMKPGVWPMLRIPDRIAHEDQLFDEGIERRTPLGDATLRCNRARPMVDRWLTIINEDPTRWLPEDFLAWRERCEHL